jgi:hypothetical protein
MTLNPVRRFPNDEAASVARHGEAIQDPSKSCDSPQISLPKTHRAYSYFEFWPAFIFYAPAIVYFMWQALLHRSISVPAVANPTMENGGLWGESKVRLFESMTPRARRWLAPYVSIVRGGLNDVAYDTGRILNLINQAGIGFPFVAKPDIGCKGNGVRVIRDTDELRQYVESFPAGARLLLQRLAVEPGEAGIFYVRRPDEDMGHIISITLKFVPSVRGDGGSTLEQLIRFDPRSRRIARLYLQRFPGRAEWVPAHGENVRLVFVGNHCKGAIFRNGAEFITPALTRRIDEIAKAIPGFYFGRFDLRFSSLDLLRNGESFTLIEYNGGGSEATHIWDADMALLAAYRDLFKQLRLIFEIGAANRRKGHKPDRWYRIIGAWWQQSRLMRRYPANE